MNQTRLECRQFSHMDFHASCVCSPVQMCVHMHICPCVCVGWLGGPREEEMVLWMVCAQRHSKSTLPGGQEHLIVQQAMIALREGSRKREREGNKETESGKEINCLCHWLSLLMGENLDKNTFSFSCATSTSVLGVMKCVCVVCVCVCVWCVCVCLYDWPGL